MRDGRLAGLAEQLAVRAKGNRRSGRQLIHEPVAHVVAVFGMLAARVTEPDDQLRRQDVHIRMQFGLPGSGDNSKAQTQ